jgi:hypothetical protein
MYTYTLKTGWNVMRGDLIFTVATLDASQRHSHLARPLEAHLDTWTRVDGDITAADDKLIKADARVEWMRVSIADAAANFSAHLLLACGQNRAHPTYARFFPTAVHGLARVTIERQLDALSKFSTLATEITLSDACAAALRGVLTTTELGRAALSDRGEATRDITRATLRQETWRDEANTLRRKAETALADYATDHKLPRAYAARFFPSRKAARKPAPKRDERPSRAPAQPVAQPARPTQPTTPVTAPATPRADDVLALPDDILRGLAEDFVAALPANVQTVVRARRTG